MTFELKGSIESRKVPIAYKFKKKKNKSFFEGNINRASDESIYIKERFIKLKNSLSDNKNDLIEEFIDISEDNSIKM